jgi:hypothetical protein
MLVGVTAISIDALANAMIERLNATLPLGYRAERGTGIEPWKGAYICLYAADGLRSESLIGDFETSVEIDDLEAVVIAALDRFQGDFAEGTGIAWPVNAHASTPLAPPWATLGAGLLTFGYGSVTLGRDVPLATLRE